MRVAAVTVPLVCDSIFVAGFTLLAFAAFNRRRTRARWASILFASTVILGLAYSITCLMLDTRWIALGTDAYRKVSDLLHYAGGLVMGLLISLLASGQLGGTKRA
jgi:hypothetical protein